MVVERRARELQPLPYPEAAEAAYVEALTGFAAQLRKAALKELAPLIGDDAGAGTRTDGTALRFDAPVPIGFDLGAASDGTHIRLDGATPFVVFDDAPATRADASPDDIARAFTQLLKRFSYITDAFVDAPDSPILAMVQRVGSFTAEQFEQLYRPAISAAIGPVDPLANTSDDVRVLIEQRIAENIRLVRDLSSDAYESLQKVVTEASFNGTRPPELAKLITQRLDVSESRARLIARDQVSKTMAAVNESKQRAAGITSFRWSSSLDERVRPECAANEGKTFPWGTHPAPGERVQCRCSAIPVVSFYAKQDRQDTTAPRAQENATMAADDYRERSKLNPKLPARLDQLEREQSPITIDARDRGPFDERLDAMGAKFEAMAGGAEDAPAPRRSTIDDKIAALEGRTIATTRRDAEVPDLSIVDLFANPGANAAEIATRFRIPVHVLVPLRKGGTERELLCRVIERLDPGREVPANADLEHVRGLAVGLATKWMTANQVG